MSFALAAVAVGALALSLYWAVLVVAGDADNDRILGLIAGHDLTVSDDDVPEVLRARAYFLLSRGRIDKAEALIDPITRSAAPDLTAAFFHDLGNARLVAAFEGIANQDIDEATPHVRLAKEAYRRALAIRPDAYATKVNLDLASRLVRDFPPGSGAEDEPDPKSQPKNLWTELPGVPEGLP